MSDAIIHVHAGNTSESWLVVYPDGRIKYHQENDGARFMNRGPEAIDKWIDLAEVARLEQQHGKQLMAKVRDALEIK